MAAVLERQAMGHFRMALGMGLRPRATRSGIPWVCQGTRRAALQAVAHVLTGSANRVCVGKVRTRSRAEGDGRSDANQCCDMKADLGTIGPEATLKARRCVGPTRKILAARSSLQVASRHRFAYHRNEPLG